MVYARLTASENRAVEELLLGTFDELPPEYRPHAIRTLLDRNDESARLALIERFNDVTRECKQVMLDDIHQFESALLQIVRTAPPQSRINALTMIVESRAWSLSYILAASLRHRTSATRRIGAEALHTLARSITTAVADTTWSRQVPSRLSEMYEDFRDWRRRRDLVASGLREALSSYDVHRRLTIMEACVGRADDLEDELLELVDRPQAKGWPALSDVIRRRHDRAAARIVLAGLGRPRTRGAMATALTHLDDSAFVQGLAGEAWLAGDPEVHHGLGGVRQFEWLADQHALLNLDVASLRKILRVVRASSAPEQTRIECYRRLVLGGDPAQQRLGVLELMRVKDETVVDVLRALLPWAHSTVTVLARRELHRRTRHLQEDTPATAEGSIEFPPHFQALWDTFDALDIAAQVQRSRHVMQREPHAWEAVGAALKAPMAQHRLRAVQIVRAAEGAKRFADALRGCAADSDARVRSAAIKALVHVGDADALRVLEGALKDPDRRVRANATEALDELAAPQRVTQLGPRLRDPDHRVRAAAIAALLKLRVPEAADALLRMLDDPSRAHRISALYVIERLGLGNILDRVAQLTHDEDPKVQRRARRLLRDNRRSERSLLIPPPAEEQRS
jgi:hypothetical protein